MSNGHLKPCPFCGRIPKIDKMYDSFVIRHESLGDDDECPIATQPGEEIGMWLYDTPEEAMKFWNQRAEGKT